MTPAKVLKASAALMMQTLTDDATWVAKYQVAMERLKAKEADVKAEVSAKEGTRVGDAAPRSEPVEVAPGAIGLSQSEGDGQEPGSTTRTRETVEAGKAATSARDVGQTDVEETRNVVETLRDAGKRRSCRNCRHNGGSRNWKWSGVS
jgi:cytochrome c